MGVGVLAADVVQLEGPVGHVFEVEDVHVFYDYGQVAAQAFVGFDEVVYAVVGVFGVRGYDKDFFLGGGDRWGEADAAATCRDVACRVLVR